MPNIKSVQRAMSIVALFNLNNPEIGVTEAAEKLQITKSTATRLMQTLASADILARSPNNRKYRLGAKVMELAETFISQVDLKNISQPYLEYLRTQTGETVNIDIVDGDERICVLALESLYNLRLFQVAGQRAPLTAGAPGKLLTAYLPENKVEQIINKQGLPAYTKYTITSKSKFKEEIRKIRESGYSISKGEHYDFCFGISAPIKDYSGKVIAALTSSGVLMRLNPQKEEEIKKQVMETAAQISRDLGYWRKTEKGLIG
jgi:IclR family KDG regulon transcriptional repressor